MRLAATAFAFALILARPAPSLADDKDTRVYELRTYHVNPGKLDALNARFKDHTVTLFEKHGMTNGGYFTPIDNAKDTRLIYFMIYPSKEARDKSWKAFLADPDWKKVYAETTKNGKLVNKVDSHFLKATDYSPPLKLETKGDRVFELRTYTATKGNLGTLDDRFKDHTMKLFDEHGMTNIVYWHLLPGSKDAERTLVYLLAHKSQAAAKQSFAEFAKDPAWVAAKKASEVKGGGSLTEKVVSVFMKPTDYSPLK
ncbi:MAG TPA: NIPSNAP family protein [Gemmataceae bacterium]